ncbi:MAG: 5'/3'-nucleotidase SurE, partial [Planctomycetota bacterium]
MKVLLTNDDGITAPGIRALHAALGGAFDELYTVAPLTVQSATSHGVTFNEPLMVRPSDDPLGKAVDGRPADCVKLALSEL